jgi:predicted transposase YdaD
MYDNTCKYLAENFPEDLSRWLLGVPISLVQMQPTELSVEPIRADSMILSAMSYILAGLVLDQDLVGRIIRRDIMWESVTYQEILAEGEVKGKTQGLAEGRAEEAKSLTIRLLTRKLGNVSPTLLAKIEALPLERLELLCEDLLDFNSIANLEQWLA